MHLEEFEARAFNLTCRNCGHIGLDTVHTVQNNGVSAHCPGCGGKGPYVFDGPPYLSQNNAAKRRVKRPKGDPTPAAVWAENGNCCAFCGLTWEECEWLGISRQNQHILPYADGGEESPLIPFCARCQQMSVALLAITHLIRDKLKLLRDKDTG